MYQLDRLAAAIRRWRSLGRVDLTSGHPAADPVLDRWLDDVRHGSFDPEIPGWLRAALGVLGIRWSPGADRA